MHAKTLGVPPEVGDRRLKPNKSGGAFSPTSSAFGRGPEGQDQPPLPKRESESTARNAKTWLTAGTRRLKAPDWLTGDDDAEAESAEAVPGRDRKERVTPREPVSAASYTGEEPRIDEAGKEVYRSSARYRRSSSRNGSSSKEADEPVPVQQKEMDRNQSMSPLKEDWDPIAQISPDTSDVESADEAEEPEEVEGMRRYATHASTSADAGEARKAADAERAAGKVAEGQEESGKPRAGPGRVKAPSWLVDTSTERAPSKPTPSTGLDAKKPALEVEEPPSPEAQVAQVADETWERRPLAPAWDEEDADEIRALPPPRLGAGMSARDKTGTLVDVESEEREASKAYENGRVVPNRRADRLVDIDDDEVEPPKPTKPTRQMADAATSPVHPGLPVEIAPTPTPIMASSSAADRAAMVASPGPASPPPKLATPIPASPRSNRGPSDSITSIVGQYESMHVGAGPEPGSPARRPVSPSKTGRMLRSVGGPAQDETKGFQSRFPALNEPPSRERPEPEEPEEKPDRRLGGPSRGASMQPRPSSPKKADSTLPPASSSSSTAEPKSPTKRVSSFVHERQRSFGARVGDSASSPAPSPSSSPVAALAPSSPARSATQPSAGHGLRVSDRLTGVQTGSGVTPSPTPARPTPVRPTTLKPWEREAAAAAEANSSGLVRSSSFAPDTGGSGGGAQSDEAFSGVGSLINRWQATAEARGQVGRKGVQAGLNPVAAAAANAAGGTALKRASTVGGPKARLPGRET